MSAFVGVLVVTFFSQGTSEALSSVVSNGGLLNKIAVEPEIFPIAAIAANVFQQTITTFPIIVVLTAVLTHDPIHVALVPVVLIALVALVAGFGLALSALFVFWMTSPVFYPAALVPEKVRPWFEINPVGLAIAALRDVVLGRGPVDMVLIGKFVLIAAVFASLGHVIFSANRRHFMDLL